MSAINLILLGFLLEKEMSPYDLVSHIEDRQINKFLKISTPAVYKRLKGLALEGFIQGKAMRQGAQSEKTVYTINKKGKERFVALMEHHSSTFPPFFFDCNAFIWNLEKVGKSEGLQMLTNLQKALSGWQIWIVQHEKEVSNLLPFSSRAIVKQYRMMVFTLVEWIEEVIMDYKKLK